MATPWTTVTGPNADSMREEGIWRTLQANNIKTALKIWGIIDLVTTIVIIIFWLFDATPLLPPGILEYAVIYNILHVGSGALALVASGSRSDAVFALEAVYSVVELILDAWAIITLILWFIGCLTGSPITFFTNCVIDALTRFVIMILAIILFFCTVFIFAKSLEMVTYLNNSRRQNRIARDQEKSYKAQ